MRITDLQPDAELLFEKQMIFNKGVSYGQVVFMMGGAGSGKGFVINNFMQGEKFKQRNVDDFKTLMIKISKIKNKFPALKSLDLKNPNDVFKLHDFIEKKGIVDKSLNLLLTDLKETRLPNIIFDRTGKTIQNIMKRIPPLLAVGYKSENIHLVWVLTDYRIAMQRNKKRSRVVADDVVLKTHAGAAATMNKIIQGKTKLIGSSAINGEIKVVLNNPSNTIFWEDDDGNPLLTTKGEKVIKGFTYVTVKKARKKTTGIRGLKDTLYKWILDNVPAPDIMQGLDKREI